MTAALAPRPAVDLPFTVTGTVGFLGRDDEHGRFLDAAGFVFPEVPIPLLAVYSQTETWAKVVGVLSAVWQRNDEVRVEGRLNNVARGTYPCGMTLVDVELDLVDPAGEKLTDAALAAMVDAGGHPRSRIRAARLRGVTLYLPGSGMRPSFPGAELVVS